QNPINLGPQINSAYDEVAPFLTKGSKLLFFSSNRLEGYGGFDLHFSTYNITNASWQQPNNLGASINSPMDDIDLFISSDGVFGMFASNRNGGYGGFDIYQVFFSEQIIDQLEYTDIAFFTNTTSSSNSGAIDNATFYDIDKSINSINLPRREYLNSPMFYNEKNINTIAISFIKNIQDLMLIYQNLELTIIVSRGFDQNREVSLYQSIKTGVNIANEIIKNTNIKSSRINVVGLGSNMPIVSLESPSSERMNNRIEFIFTADNLPELKIIEDPSIINNYIIGDGYYTLQLFKTRLSYTVPFATTAQMLRTDLVKTDPRTIISKNLAENNYTYSLAFFKSYQDARLQKNELLKKNLLNARVLPFINGVNIPTYKLDFYLEKFEDLSEYKKYEILE
ncbi:MAG TPA: hypothetical protein PKD85_07455, partial [Saprospiraceae bacterium]|nr:hypothetical protein [Saprospiraceae bacterium]